MSDNTDVEALFEKEEADREKIGDAKTWKPKEGDIIHGTLLEGKWVNTKHGDTRVLNVEDKDGQVWAVWASAKMLADELDAKAPKIGSHISIKFSGKKEPKKEGGYSYNLYQLHAPDEDHEYWYNNKRAFHQKTEELEAEALGGSHLAPDADSGLTAPF